MSLRRISRVFLPPLLLGVLVALAGCAAGPTAPSRDPFLVEIEAGEASMDAHALDTARPHLDAALAIAQERGRRSPEQGRAQLGLARWHRMSGEPRKARHHLGLARFATRAALGDETLAMANVEVESSFQHQAAGSLDQAVSSLREALALRQSLLPADAHEIAETLTLLGFAAQRAASYSDAVSLMRQALRALEGWTASPERTRLELSNRDHLAWIYERAALEELAATERERARVLAASLPAATARDRLPRPSERQRDEMRTFVEFTKAWIDTRGIARKHFSMETLMLAVSGRLDRGTSASNARTALEQDLHTAYLAFAPETSKPRHGERYHLPFDGPIARRVSHDAQAHGYEHVYLHAVDFEMPAGSSVVTARAGVVARVISGFAPSPNRSTGRSVDASHGDQLNRVMILHDDGTYASYFPLAPGIHVYEGLRVEVGDKLGETASTGAASPILHFDVRRNVRQSGRLMGEPVRIAFHGVSDRDGVPLAGHFYGGDERPQPAARDYRVR